MTPTSNELSGLMNPYDPPQEDFETEAKDEKISWKFPGVVFVAALVLYLTLRTQRPGSWLEFLSMILVVATAGWFTNQASDAAIKATVGKRRDRL